MIDLSIIKFLAPIFISGILIMPSHSTGFQTPFSWSQRDNGSAAVIYTSDYSDDAKYFESEISHSKSGSQRLYFDDYYISNLNTCNYQTTVPDNTTIVFNGQAVKMLRWCKKFGDADKYYYSLTPETDRGHSYVVNLFKVASSSIKIQYNNDTLYFPVTGFTKAWNSAGGNAI
jgi:hypothetical protein